MLYIYSYVFCVSFKVSFKNTVLTVYIETQIKYKLGVKDMTITLYGTACCMIESLKSAAESCEISYDDIREVFKKGEVDKLDDLFNDGGEVRCEEFTDLSWDYAFQFGVLESDEFEKARWEAIDEAMRIF